MKKLTKNTKETQDLAKELLEEFGEGRVWLLYGDLGAGKTTFVKGLSESIGMQQDKIKSPTFTFVAEHPHLIHYDLYRLTAPDESILELLKEHLKTGKTILIEWPEVLEHEITCPHIKVRLTHLGKDRREFIITPHL